MDPSSLYGVVGFGFYNFKSKKMNFFSNLSFIALIIQVVFLNSGSKYRFIEVNAVASWEK